MSNIYLVRHATYANPRKIIPGRLPVELSEFGFEQAQALHTFFKDKHISTIYSSAVLRCRQTAEIIAGVPEVSTVETTAQPKGQIEIKYEPRLLETFSAYQGYWSDNWNGTYYEFYANRDQLGGENLQDIQKRVWSFWQDLQKSFQIAQENDQPTPNVIICSHGDPLQVLYATIFDQALVEEGRAPGSHLAGWLEKGQYLQLVWQDGHVIQKTDPRLPG